MLPQLTSRMALFIPIITAEWNVPKNMGRFASQSDTFLADGKKLYHPEDIGPLVFTECTG